MHNRSYPLPNTINGYILQQSLDSRYPSTFLHYGIYRHPKTNKLAFVKQCSGSTKRSAYHELHRELIFYRYLASLSQVPKFTFPKLLYFVNTKHKLTIMTEYLHGTTLEKMTTEQQSHTIHECIKKFHSLPPPKGSEFYMMPEWVGNLLLRTPLAILRHPRFAFKILSGVTAFISGVIFDYRRPELVLTHRDLNPGNFIVSGKQTYLIDFQLVCLADSLIDYANVIHQMWKQPNFYQTFLRELDNYVGFDVKSKRWLIRYVMYFAIYHLSLPDWSAPIASYDCLNYSLSEVKKIEACL